MKLEGFGSDRSVYHGVGRNTSCRDGRWGLIAAAQSKHPVSLDRIVY